MSQKKKKNVNIASFYHLMSHLFRTWAQYRENRIAGIALVFFLYDNKNIPTMTYHCIKNILYGSDRRCSSKPRRIPREVPLLV